MSNTFLKPDAITAESLRVLHNSMAFVGNIDKQHDKKTEFGGQKRGSTLRIRLPNQYTVRETWASTLRIRAKPAFRWLSVRFAALT